MFSMYVRLYVVHVRKNGHTHTNMYICKNKQTPTHHHHHILARSGTGGILGDDMGLGKTVQTTAFLMAVLGKKATIQDKCTDEELMAEPDRKKPVLIACPASLLIQVT